MRDDSGVQEGAEILIHYDPMIVQDLEQTLCLCSTRSTAT